MASTDTYHGKMISSLEFSEGSLSFLPRYVIALGSFFQTARQFLSRKQEMQKSSAEEIFACGRLGEKFRGSGLGLWEAHLNKDVQCPLRLESAMMR